MHILSLIKANLRHKKDSFISVLLLMFLIATVLTMVMSVSQNSKVRVGKSLEAANAGDLVLWFNEGTLTSEATQKVEALKQVEKVDIVKAIYSEEGDNVTISGKKAGQIFEFQVYDPSNHQYPVFSENGMSFEDNPKELKSGEIYLPVCFKSKYSCNLNDKVSIKTGKVDMTYTVKGFVEEPTMGNPLINGYKNVFISKIDFDKLFKIFETKESGLSIVDIVQVYRSDDTTLNDSEFSKLLNETAGFIDSSDTTVSKNQFVMYSSMLVNIFAGVLSVFGILLFIVILIVIGHNISTAIEMDYVNLGILKSQGFTGKNLRQVYIYQYLAAEVIGSILGFIVGIFVTSVVGGLTVQMTGLLAGRSVAIVPSVVTIFVMILLSIIFVILKSRSIGKVAPMNAISGSRDTKNSVLKVRAKISKRALGFSMAFRQLSTNSKQYINSAVIVAILVYFMMAVGTISTCLSKDNILEEFYGFKFDIEVAYGEKENLKTDVEKLIKENTDIESSSIFYTTFFNLKGDKVLGNVVENGLKFTNVFKGNVPSNGNEVVITEVLADAYDLKIGDKITVGYGDKTGEYSITGYYQSVNNAGKQFSMLTSGLNRLDSQAKLNTIDYIISDSNKAEEITTKLEEKFGSDIKVTTSEDVMGSIKTISSTASFSIFIIYGISIIFIIVVAYMVCGKVFLKEKKDYGIYKAMGFTSKNLRTQFSLRFFMVACFGSIFGALLNAISNKSLIELLLKSMGITNFNANYTIVSFLGPIILMAVTFLCCSYITSRKIKKVNTKSLIVE